MPAQLHFGTGDSVAFGTTGNATATTASFNKSSLTNMAIGDLLVAFIHNQSSAAGTVSTPAGWTHYGPAVGSASANASRISGFYYFKVTSQQDIDNFLATTTWTFSIAGRIASHVVRATGIDLANPEDSAASGFNSATSGTTTFAISSLTTIAAHTLLIGGLHHQNSASTSSPTTTDFMTAFTVYKTAPTGSALANTGTALGYKELTAAGSTGAVTATFDSTITQGGGALVAFRALTSTPPTGLTVKYTSAQDTLSNATLYYTSATNTLATPSEVRPFPAGYSSVNTMLNTTPFYAAHRGGSKNWPEMSLYSYTQAGFWGVGALELSLSRTSDGVWFGLHDATLDRTSGTSGFTASAHTWAEVQQYMITAAETNDTSQPTRPYARWEEIMAAYYSTHVIFIDPKEAYAYTSELLTMMDAMPGNPRQRFIAKGYGVSGNAGNTTGWAYEAAARNYQTWGYFYQADSANIDAYQGRWTILGMDYAADQATWTTIKGYGKKVIGHVVPTAAAATTALSKGADGLMVSGVQEAVPRLTY